MPRNGVSFHSFAYPVVSAATILFPPPHTPVIPLPKCEHGVYLESPEALRTKRARYCCWCRPEMYEPPAAPVEVKKLKLPETHVGSDRLYANKHHPDRCPRCRSQFKYELPDGRLQCADCEKIWGKKIQRKLAAA